MVKIKTKKQLSLPQLIQWGFENDVTGTIFSDNRVDAKRIRFEVGTIISINGYMHKGDTFTVEAEEEITEDTVIPILVTKNIIGDYNEWKDRSIKDFVPEHMEAIYIPNDDLTLTLICRDGKLIE